LIQVEPLFFYISPQPLQEIDIKVYAAAHGLKLEIGK